uniref:complement C3-like n=1 Tax=Styela clava TaxID=7725 RepID=UPI0019397F44|nr:complement C3-like [Styela clava]
MMKLTVLMCICAVTLFHKGDAACKHFMVTPKGLRINSPENFFISFHGCSEVVTVSTTLLSYPGRAGRHDQSTIRDHVHGNKPVRLTVQAKSASLERSNERLQYKAFLIVKYCFPPNCNLNQMTDVEEMTIMLNNTHGYVFMTTDRPAYRPKDTVHLALAITDQRLRKTDERRSVKLLIKTPEEHNRVTAIEMNNLIADQDGFIEKSYAISSEPILGVWWAEAHIDGVKMAEKSYVIDRYETPTFDVKIHMKNHFILPSQQHIEGFITAQYSYGENVDGQYYMSFRLARDGQEEEEFYKIPRSFSKQAAIGNGEKSFRIPIDELTKILREGETLRQFAENPGTAKVIVMASVTGDHEAVFESDVVDDIIFTNSPFVIDYSQCAKYYLPHSVYEVKVTIRDVVSNSPLPDIPVIVEWGKGRDRDFRSNKHGEIYHEMNLEGDPAVIEIKTDSEDFPLVNQELSRIEVSRNIANLHLAMRIQKRIVEVGESQHVTFILGNVSPQTIIYYVIARGQFVYSNFVELKPGQIGDVPADFDVTDEMVPNARVVAYYILGETLASNSIWFDVINVCKEELKISTPKSTVAPGEGVSMVVEGEPNVAFFFSAIDRASYFVHNGTRVTRDLLWSKMEEYDTACSRKGGRDAHNVFEEAGLIINTQVEALRQYSNIHCVHSRKKRNAHPAPLVLDDLTAAEKMCSSHGAREAATGRSCLQRTYKVEENLRWQQKSAEYIDACMDSFMTGCEESPQHGKKKRSELARKAASAANRANEVRTRVRKQFNENMFFGKETLSGNRLYEIRAKAQDSITIFELDAFGMNAQTPMCVAHTKYLKVFQDFFIQLYLPYSVRLREQAEIRFSVFNYRDQPAQVPIFIRHSKELCSKFAQDDFQFLKMLEIEPNSARSSSFTVMPLSIPDNKKATIELQAGDEDAILKKLLIEEPGQRNESSKTIVLDPEENVKELFFDVSEQAVMPDTLKCTLYAHAHPMGPSIEIEGFEDSLDNLDGFIQPPAGCGEQNMIRIGPIVFIHKYRVAVNGGEISQKLEQQTKNHISSAYRIQLKWRSDKAKVAFAVWNYRPPSTWLNAYVDRVFAAAKQFDQAMEVKPFCDSLDWLLTKQNEDGTFVENYKVYHQEMIGQIKAGEQDYEIALTAYVNIAIRESMYMCPDRQIDYKRAIDKSNDYLIDKDSPTPYTLAMGAYALALADPPEPRARDWNRRLRDVSENDGEYIFWSGTRGRASTIETTAYALMALLALDGINEDNDQITRNAAHWLISQQNSKGGFKSTQDTVCGLQALSMYMEILETSQVNPPPPTNLRATITGKSGDSPWHLEPEVVHLTPEDSMKRRTIEVDQGSIAGGVTVAVAGVGVGSLSYRCTWRQYTDDGNCQFNINVSFENDDDGQPDISILKVSVAMNSNRTTQMSVIDVGLLSGFEPIIESIKRLCIEEAVDAEADRFEITENTVKFYLTKIDQKGVNLAFKIKQVTQISDRQPASVSVYDYYEPDIRCTKFYEERGEHTIRSICREGEADQGEDAQMCRCAEGDCPVCRTREDQLTRTICSDFEQLAMLCLIKEKDQLRPQLLCQGNRDDCTNIHVESCKSEYVYVVHVVEVGNDQTPGFKYFKARVDEVMRATANHKNALGAVVKFLMREDCFKKCHDERYDEIAQDKSIKTGEHVEPKDFISIGRDLMIRGGHPRRVKSETGPEPLYVYDLTQQGHGIEAVLPSSKCHCPKNSKCQKKLDADAKKKAICQLKSTLRASINQGCDVARNT